MAPPWWSPRWELSVEPGSLVDLDGDLPVGVRTRRTISPGVHDWVMSDATPSPAHRPRDTPRWCPACPSCAPGSVRGTTDAERWQAARRGARASIRHRRRRCGYGVPHRSPSSKPPIGRCSSPAPAPRAPTRRDARIRPSGVVLVEEPAGHSRARRRGAIDAPVDATIALDPPSPALSTPGSCGPSPALMQRELRNAA